MLNYPFVEPTFGRRFSQLAIGQSLFDANAFDIRSWKSAPNSNSEMLPETVFDFLSLLKKLEVDFCIVGGIAYLAYIQDRNTKDLDVLISVKELQKVVPYLVIINEDANFVNAEFQNMRIDFLKTSNSLFDHVKKRETTVYDFVEGDFPIATVAGLILMRFDAIIDLYQKGNFNKAMRYENDLQFLTINYEIEWNEIWKISEQFFTKGQIAEFVKMVTNWQQPRVNPFA